MADTIMRSSTADPRLGDAYSVGFGANYKIGDVTPYLGFQLGRNETVWSWVGASSFLSGSYLAKHNVSGVVGQFDGWSTTVGALFENMPGTPGANIQAAVFYGKAGGEIFNADKATEKAAFEEDLEKYGFIAMYIFPLSKKALVYAGGAYTAERMERSEATPASITTPGILPPAWRSPSEESLQTLDIASEPVRIRPVRAFFHSAFLSAYTKV